MGGADLLGPPFGTTVDEDTARRAARFVAATARDEDDARLLLDMLGLLKQAS